MAGWSSRQYWSSPSTSTMQFKSDHPLSTTQYIIQPHFIINQEFLLCCYNSYLTIFIHFFQCVGSVLKHLSMVAYFNKFFYRLVSIKKVRYVAENKLTFQKKNSSSEAKEFCLQFCHASSYVPYLSFLSSIDKFTSNDNGNESDNVQKISFIKKTFVHLKISLYNLYFKYIRRHVYFLKIGSEKTHIYMSVVKILSS